MLIATVLVSLVIAYASSACLNDRLEKGSREYFEHGQFLVEDNSAADSLAFFRTAVRMCPLSGLYLQRLGEVEYMTGHYDLAWKRFLKALTLEGANVSSIESFLAQPHFSSHREGSSENFSNYDQFPELPERSLQDIKDFGFSAPYPFVIREAFSTKDFHNFTNLDRLRTIYGEESIEFYPQNMQEKPKKVYNVKLSKALDYFDYPDGAYVACDVSEVGAYIQWNIDSSRFDHFIKSHDEIGETRNLLGPLQEFQHHLKDFVLNSTRTQQLSETQLHEMIESFGKQSHWYMVLIGEENAGMFMHTDNLPVGSWQMELVGEKRWVICSPAEPSLEGEIPQCEAHEAMNGVCMAKDSCKKAIVRPGDILFYPPNYWHQTTCLTTPTISFSGTVVTDYQTLADSIHQECLRHTYGYQFSTDLCAILAKAQISK